MHPASSDASIHWDDSLFDRPGFDPLEVLDAEAWPEAPWASAVRKEDRAAAASALVKTLREGQARIDLENSIPRVRLRWFGTRINENAGMAYNAADVVNLIYAGGYGITHQFEGAIDWAYDPTGGSTMEWTYGLNRHFHWLNLADAYKESGDALYARAWEKELFSWIDQMPRPEDLSQRRHPAWRTLDTGIRAGSVWPYVFETFRQSEHVSDQALWLLFAGQREHALHLMQSTAGGNWRVMETNGLGHVGILFPELKGAAEFTATALRRAKEEMDAQFFPDGTHQEFAPHYSAAGCIANFHTLAMLAEQNDRPFPREFRAALANAAHALARIAFPDGVVPALHNSREVYIPNLFSEVAFQFDPETYFEMPWAEGGSDLVPFGGYAVLRRDHFHAMLDAGPRGTSHFHNDDLQVITHAHGHKFAVDPGTPVYTNDPISAHLRTSSAHNVVLMNGRDHEPAVVISRPQVPMPVSIYSEGPVQLAAAKRTMRQTGDDDVTFSHERVLLEVEGLGWVIFDRLTPPTPDAQNTWEWIWGFDVDSLEFTRNGVFAIHEGGPSMQVLARGNVPGSFQDATGQTEPALRGWILQPRVEDYIPLPTATFHSQPVTGEAWLFTLHVPHEVSGTPSRTRIAGVQTETNAWQLAVTHENQSYRIRLQSDGFEITQATVWRGNQTMADLWAGGHTLEP